jgi:hypothetical protein
MATCTTTTETIETIDSQVRERIEFALRHGTRIQLDGWTGYKMVFGRWQETRNIWVRIHRDKAGRIYFTRNGVKRLADIRAWSSISNPDRVVMIYATDGGSLA